MTKLALCVGINNYPGTDSDLAGCVNDAQDWAAVAQARGFETMTLLDGKATRSAILAELRDMLMVAKKGDSLLFTFSGHGTQVPDENGDEPDGRDECLCAHDCFEGGLVYDDELWSLFRQKPPGVQLVMVSDSCHSGTVARKIGAPISTFGADGQFKGRRKYIPYQLLAPKALERAVPKVLNAPRLVMMEEEGAWLKGAKGAARVPWPLLLLAGCQDAEYSYDATINGRPNGAMTAYALAALKAVGPAATYNEWFVALRKHLPSRDYPQTPRMIGSYLKQPALS